MSTFVVTTIRTPEDLRAALDVRTRVFVDEQHVPIEEEVDAYDREALTRDDVVYVLGRLNGEPIATARLLFNAHEGLPHIGRVAVLAEHRGQGYGRVVMQALHEAARERGRLGVTLAAQLQALPFYERLGYVARGPVFLDAGIEHRDMDLRFD